MICPCMFSFNAARKMEPFLLLSTSPSHVTLNNVLYICQVSFDFQKITLCVSVLSLYNWILHRVWNFSHSANVTHCIAQLYLMLLVLFTTFLYTFLRVSLFPISNNTCDH